VHWPLFVGKSTGRSQLLSERRSRSFRDALTEIRKRRDLLAHFAFIIDAILNVPAHIAKGAFGGAVERTIVSPRVVGMAAGLARHFNEARAVSDWRSGRSLLHVSIMRHIASDSATLTAAVSISYCYEHLQR
jgi:hypothetical protein